MTEDSDAELIPFTIFWNTRNLPHIQFPEKKEQNGVIDSKLGEYPIDGWNNIFIEIPLDAKKSDLSGRSNYKRKKEQSLKRGSQNRIIKLPVYSQDAVKDVRKLKHIIKHWSEILFGEDIPCIALATKCRGFYSDQREAQIVTVLMVWNDSTARMTTLEWYEGPLDDCISPEWHMRSTSYMSLVKAIEKFKDTYSNINWDGMCYALYIVPQCLGHCIQSRSTRTSYPSWVNEWQYKNQTFFKKDLSSVLSDVHALFSSSGNEVG
jgi:hypothetical protein